jgi:hypothetical protein
MRGYTFHAVLRVGYANRDRAAAAIPTFVDDVRAPAHGQSRSTPAQATPALDEPPDKARGAPEDGAFMAHGGGNQCKHGSTRGGSTTTVPTCSLPD